MNNFLKLLFIIILFQLTTLNAQDAKEFNWNKQIENYNIKWNSQSKNSSESMPLGGGDIGLNVWVENGDILFYISQSGTLDENNQFLKHGRTRITLEPNIFSDKECNFSQELKLKEGYIEIVGEKDGDIVTVNLWVDVHKPVVHVDVNSNIKTDVVAKYETWRYKDRELPLEERHATFSYSGYLGKITTYKDSIAFSDNNVIWSHSNKPDKLLFDFIVEQQGLSSFKDEMVNTQKDLIFGGLLLGNNMEKGNVGTGKYIATPFKSFSLKSKEKAFNHEIAIVLLTKQINDYKKWENEIVSISNDVFTEDSWEYTKQWWEQLWERSYISINRNIDNSKDKGWQVGRNYQLFRYMLACNAFGSYPTKFNGGLFTYDPQVVDGGSINYVGTPDFRSWGGGSFTAQNQRLVYWPMLKTGDFDMMPSQFKFYTRSLKNAELRTKAYWNHEGASFTEHTESFGLPAASTWGFDSGRRKRSKEIEHGTLTNKWVRLHYTNQLEFSFMILKYNEYSGNDIEEYLPFIESSLTFFFEHYKHRQIKRNGEPYDKNNKLVIYPSTACETFKDIKNPTDISAALKSVINALNKLPNNILSQEKKDYWMNQYKHIPDLTYGKVRRKKILVSAKNLPESINKDVPELYPVFPYEMYGIGMPNLDIAINTWNNKKLAKRKGYISWHQDAIFCARMGLTDEAEKVTILKLQDSGRRFPAFWGPGNDYVPDHNWGGSGMIGLQDMLIQSNNGKIYLLPAWPKDWDVDFKLRAPNNIVIECSFRDGEIQKLNVYPKERRKDVIIKF